MKLSQVLCKQHLGRMIKFNWFASTHQKLRETDSEAYLAAKGITPIKPDEYLKEPPPLPRLDANEFFKNTYYAKPPPKDSNHPDWNELPCYRHGNYDLLVKGTDQALLLTKTLLVDESLPQEIEDLKEEIDPELNKKVERLVYSSNIFDGWMEKLPKRKDPERPAWNFPRDYGITDVRKSYNLSTSFLELCDLLSGPKISRNRQILRNGLIQLPIEKNSNLVLFNMTMDCMVMSTKGLSPLRKVEDVEGLAFPDIYPLDPIISLHPDHFYQANDVYPVSENSSWINIHTLFIFHDVVNVKNLSERPVHPDQLLARSLIKSFVAAAGYARQKYGDDIKDLPEPVTVQCIQCNGQSFHFSVFQLNTLDISGTDGISNFWWSMPSMNLFDKADFEDGRPVLSNLNVEVFQRILAFYKNQ